jgi:phage tail-like protein
MTVTSNLDPGSSLFFRLTIDGQDMGIFNGCTGLGMQVEVEAYSEGGNNGYATQLPSRLTYSPLQLTRPLTPDSANLTTWISSIVTGIERPTIEVAALRADGTMVTQWSLLEALPSSWTGPTLDPSSTEVATETLEIVYHGFISTGASGS